MKTSLFAPRSNSRVIVSVDLHKELEFEQRWVRVFFKRCILATVLAASQQCWLFSAAGSPTVTAHTGQITLPTYGWAAVKHPYFQGTDKVNIYPYPMLDFLSRDKTNRTYRTVVLENEYLRVTFLPALGGKIYEVIDKTINQPMFYVNHVVKPGLIAQCGAWTSGGVEWNTGPQGHTVGCMQPVEVRILPPDTDGSRSVAIGEIERVYGTKWTVIVTLHPGRAFLEERIRIYNPTETIRPYYFWNCTAAPNTAGFRFIYPMTLGMDHSGEKFFHWPVDAGRDLRYGTNYQDASSIFAYLCDQDFFGSYNDDLGRGVVSYANHHQVPGKKAWTWGYGSYGTMHQADLTDSDGPYNEVQTGPLLTQGEVGRLDPCEAVEWREWWYPVHGTGGLTFANKNIAANTEAGQDQLHLQLMGSGVWRNAKVIVSLNKQTLFERACDISPSRPVELRVPLPAGPQRLEITVQSGAEALAQWPVPLQLPERTIPQKPAAPKTASELAQAGWGEFLFAKFSKAAELFAKALESDSKCAEAHCGLAYIYQERDEAKSAEEARAAIAAAPDSGLAHYVLAVAEARLGNDKTALEEAWKAALDPAAAIPGRALVAKMLIRHRQLDAAIEALSQEGPWQSDSVCRDRLALALWLRGRVGQAQSVTRQALEQDPLDDFANSLLWMAERMPQKGSAPLGGNTPTLLELAAQYNELGCREQAFKILDKLYVNWPHARRNPLLDDWYTNLSASRQAGHEALTRAFGTPPVYAAEPEDLPNLWPHHYELLPVLERAVESEGGSTALAVGDLLFKLGRYDKARQMWQRAAESGERSVIACRSLGMAGKTLDGDLNTARRWLKKANQADGQDAIVARDLAGVLSALADQAQSETEKRALHSEARECLRAAFSTGRTRSDFIALLAREQNKLGEFAETATMLDHVRVIIWEGAHEVHDLFEQAHLALGEEKLKGGHPAEALAEFDRALEYPANLATGRLENAPEAHIQYQRGNALAALGRKTDAIAAWKLAADSPESKVPGIEEARLKAKQALESAR